MQAVDEDDDAGLQVVGPGWGTAGTEDDKGKDCCPKNGAHTSQYTPLTRTQNCPLDATDIRIEPFNQAMKEMS